MIGGLVNYVLSHKDEDGKDKCAWSFGLNFFAATTEGQRAEMIALAEDTPRSRMPVAHWLLSWNENEIPTGQQIKDAVKMFLGGMELAVHQCIVAVHTNTQNIHAHILVNRVHPDTNEVIQPHNGFDIEAVHKIVAAIEKIQGWTPQKNARYRLDENNQFIRNKPREKPEPSEKAQKFESETAAKSAQRITQERAHKIIEKAASWEELHNGLKKVGLRLEKKGSGAIVFVGETAIKASAIDRNFSLGKLCKRLGEFQPGDYAAHVEKIDPEPLTHVAQKSWREYMGLREIAIAERRQKREEIRQQREAAMREVLEKQLAHREMAYKGIAQFGWSVLNIGRSFLKRQQIQERAEARNNLPKMPKNDFKRFKGWLRERKPWLADAWRIHRWITPDMKIGHFPEGHFPRTGKMKQPFAAYAEMVKRRYADLKAAKSRLDAATVLHLRCAGYLRKEVEKELERHTPAPANLASPPAGMDYQRRILDYAFGAQGDIIVIEHKLKMSEIEQFNQEAKIIDNTLKMAEQAQNQNLSRPNIRRMR